MSFHMHPAYEQLIAKARASHAANRSTAGIDENDIALARLYSYAYRNHVIGGFHAARAVLSESSHRPPGAAATESLPLALDLLQDLTAFAVDPIPTDFRALLSTFYRYHVNAERVVALLKRACSGPSASSAASRVNRVRERFVEEIERISKSAGIVCRRDDEVPEQASLIIPNLGITIVPLVYGDQHSWNLAYLAGTAADVPRHRHEQGVEIHLGFGLLEGYTLLGDYRALVREGYAMAIPPGVPHGFKNTHGQPHFLPFIFGSKRLGGWGIVLDVEARPIALEELQLAEPASAQLNHMIQLDREIERTVNSATFERRLLVKPEATRRPETGGLALGIARVAPGGLSLAGDSYRIVSVVRGTGLARVGPAEQRVGSHDHFGIPTGMSASLQPIGNEPLVILEATLE